MGNPNRLVSTEQAFSKAKENGHTHFDKIILVSDAFFPFPDNIEIALDEIIDSSEGPMTKAGVLLKSLPGTNRGDSGWYLGVDGHPFHWEKKE